MTEGYFVLYFFPFTLIFQLILAFTYANFYIQYVSFVKIHGLGGFRPNRRIMDHIEWLLYILAGVAVYEYYLIYGLGLDITLNVLAGVFLVIMIIIPFAIANTKYYLTDIE